MSVSLRCPACQAQLQTAHALYSGQPMKCPRCGFVFTIGGSEPVHAILADLPSRPAPRGEILLQESEEWKDSEFSSPHDESEGDENDLSIRRRSRKRKSNRAVWIGIFLAGLGILVLGTVLVIMLFNDKAAPPANQTLVGIWQRNGFGQEKLEFLADGTLVQDVGFFRLTKKYRQIDANTLEIEETLFKNLLRDLQNQGGPFAFNNPFDELLKSRVRFVLQNDRIDFTPLQGTGLAGGYRRIR